MKLNNAFLFALLLALVVTASACLSVQRTPNNVSVVDQKLLVDGQEFYIKGVTYSPIPVGTDPKSPKRTNVEWLDHPEIYRNDFALMKRAGINTIRVMNINASVSSTRKMLDAAEEYDIHVIIGYEGPLKADLADPSLRRQIKSQITTMVRNYKDHPAVLMWMVGNEVNYWYPEEGNVEDWYTLLEEVTQEVKRIDPNHPVMTANNALSEMDMFVSISPSVDIYGTNAYSLTQGSWNWLYDQYDSYNTGKPILITEAGIDSWNSRAGKDDEGMQAALIQNILEENMNRPSGIGVILFEWNDEWWKSDHPFTQDGSNDWKPYDVEGASDGWFSEEYFGIVRQQPDTHERIPKYSYYVVRAYWGNSPVNSPPNLHGVAVTEREGTAYFVADIVTYGDVNATATVRYKNVGSEWKTASLVKEGQYYVAPIVADGKVPVLQYEIAMEDAFGQKETVEGRIVGD